MNLFAPARFSERIVNLALGLELIDAARGDRVGSDMRVAFDDTARGLPRPKWLRHNSGLHSLLDSKGLDETITLRVFDVGPVKPKPRDPDIASYDVKFDRRRFVPRRFSIPRTLEADWGNPWEDGRGRRPVLFPGANYDVPDTATGLRGQVFRGQKPVRWVRVAVYLEGADPDDDPVAWAHGDDRGEFLLLLPPLTAPVGDPSDPINYDIVIFGRDPVPVPTPQQAVDPLWDVPIEPFGVPGIDDDPVARGEQIPDEYVDLIDDTITFEPGRTVGRVFTIV